MKLATDQVATPEPVVILAMQLPRPATKTDVEKGFDENTRLGNL